MSAHGSKTAVYTAIGANVLVTAAKAVGFALTGSGAMLAETVHSFADVCNQTLLAVGMAKAQRPADAEHPYGYGRDAFIWALISAVGIFFIGCGVSVAHGVHALLSEHHEVAGKSVAVGVLLFALVIEGGSTVVAVRALASEARVVGKTLWEHIRTTDDPFGVAVLYEDGAAVLGVLLALASVGLADLTHWESWDAVGTIAIGILLGGLALALVRKNRTYLIGRSVAPQQLAAMRQALEDDPAVEHVATASAVVTGASEVRVSADIDLDGRYLAARWLEGQDLAALHARLDTPEALRAFLLEAGEGIVEQAGDEIDRLEQELQAEFPSAKAIALEPD